MPRRRHTETQIMDVLRELDAGATMLEVSRKHGIHDNRVRA
jgi:hypothetical protein